MWVPGCLAKLGALGCWNFGGLGGVGVQGLKGSEGLGLFRVSPKPKTQLFVHEKGQGRGAWHVQANLVDRLVIRFTGEIMCLLGVRSFLTKSS